MNSNGPQRPGGIAIGSGAFVRHEDVTWTDGTTTKVMTPGGGAESIAIGVNAQSHYNQETIVGSHAGEGATRFISGPASYITTYGSDSVMFGQYAGQNAEYLYATFIGDEAGRGSKGQHNTYVGQNAARWRDGSSNTALGSNALVGTSATSHLEGAGNTAVGASAGASLTGDNNAALGQNAGYGLNGSANTAVGMSAGQSVRGSYNVGSGYLSGAAVQGSYNVASGYFSGYNAQGNNNVASGYMAGMSVSASDTVSIGTSARGAADNAIAIGAGAQATGESSISIGTGNVVSGKNSGAFGDPNTVSGAGSYAFGNDNTIAQDNTFVLGNNVTTTQANSVVLGNNSADKAAVQVNDASIPSVVATLNPDGSVTYTPGPAITYGGFAGTATGVVSVGAAGTERQIVNVAPGAITATSTDAVNGSQLYSVASQVNAIGGQIVNIVNNASSHYYSTNDGGTQQANYDNSGAAGANSIAAGPGASTAAGATGSVAMGANASASTANSVALGAGSTTTAATPTSGTTIRGQDYTFAGANPAGVVSVGSAGQERQIQNVAAGQLSSTSTDAVNGSQLYATNQALETLSVTANAGINVTTAATGTGVAVGTSVANVGPGGVATYTAGNNMVLTQSGANVAFAVSENPNFTSVTVGNTHVTNNGVSIQGGPSMTTGGINANNTTITNVAPGVNGTDAVNVNQLNASTGNLQNQVNALDNRITRQGKELSGGIAASAAMAVVTPVEPGRYHLTGAVAAYNGQMGIGFNLLKRSDNGQTTLHAGVGWGSGGSKPIARVGFGFSFD
ncbi:YadA family autotransporter adhesin [Xenophilus sp.]|uniref:YadA family autotransporter adhesin n=1 Tax=Xenophilus sp. TaxID=1873499 RepID=UPI0037DD52D0